ncbi:hypothetical protein KC19_VG315900 [Ceratodon purpureus]|uniref:Uncharacterized protein n=1 Tax=Ceratodon purpureus TaxID=3225 RepID=A0A8T0HWM2_CERPU|nr:hypothetical protein KC19_VG315900 [Ceratodon purpureus]
MATSRICLPGEHNVDDSPPSLCSSQGSCSPSFPEFHYPPKGIFESEAFDMAFPARMSQAPVVDGRVEDPQSNSLNVRSSQMPSPRNPYFHQRGSSSFAQDRAYSRATLRAYPDELEAVPACVPYVEPQHPPLLPLRQIYGPRTISLRRHHSRMGDHRPPRTHGTRVQ